MNAKVWQNLANNKPLKEEKWGKRGPPKKSAYKVSDGDTDINSIKFKDRSTGHWWN